MWITTFFDKIERRNRNITKENYVIVYDTEEKNNIICGIFPRYIWHLFYIYLL
jgi:hypothetical protein